MLQLPASSNPDTANIAHTTWQCVCDCGTASHSAKNKKGAVDNWNTLQRLERIIAEKGK